LENRAYAVAAATFLIVLAIVTVLIYYWFRGQEAEPRTYKIVTSQSVGGLEVQAPVKFKGLTVGHVQEIRFAPEDPAKVRILFSVQEDAYVTHATYAQVAQAGIIGTPHLDLKLAEGSTEPLRTSEKDPARIPMHESLLDKITESVEQDLKKINQVVSRLNRLMDEENRRHLSDSIAQMDDASRRLVAIEKAMMPTLESLPELVKQGQQTLRTSQRALAEGQGLAADAREPIQKLQEVEGSVRALSESSRQLVRELTRNTLPRMHALTTRLSRAARQVEQLARTLEARPQSVIFGAPEPSPGPGEPGFEPRE
jgi:phospholipid/cholesterol/gamma-HCH transport system substrate-binding protein